MVLKELFHYLPEDNRECMPMLKEVALIAIEAIKKELKDENKATYKYLSISGSSFSNVHCSEEEKKAVL